MMVDGWDGWDGQIRVLHVDDEPAIGGLVSDFFEQEDEPFEVTTASSADEGLSTLRDGEFECVVSDYQLPGTDGLELLQAVREEYSSLPFILFTGKGSEEIASEAIASGVTDYLQKGGPEQYTVLANRVRNAVDQYRTHVELDRTREWFRTLVEEAGETIFVVDKGGDIEHASPGVEELLGYRSGKLVGRNGFDRIHPDDLAEAMAGFTAAVAEPAGRSAATFRYRHADGSWIRLDGRVRNLLDDPVVDGLVVYVREVTESRDSLAGTIANSRES